MNLSFFLVITTFIFYSNINLFSQQKSIKLISPVGNEILKENYRYNISWLSEGIEAINIYYKDDEKNIWKIAKENISTRIGSMGWKIPEENLKFIRIKIEDSADDSFFDISAKSINVQKNNRLAEFESLDKSEASLKTKLKILPLGNSITFGKDFNVLVTEDRKGYRYALLSKLDSAGYEFEFIGSEHSGSNYLTENFDANGGFSGIRDDQLLYLLQTGILAQPNYGILDTITLGPYLDHYSPDIILLHIGTNGNNEPDGTNADEVEQILNEIDSFEDSTGRNIIVILAKIINRSPVQTYVTTFNNNIELMAMDRVNNLSNESYPDKIVLVNMDTGANINYIISSDSGTISGDMSDKLHPNFKGYNKMADVWFRGINSIYEMQTTPTNLAGVIDIDPKIKLTWIDNFDNELGYVIDRKAMDADSNFITIDTTSMNIEEYIDSSPKYVSSYYYRIKAYNEVYESDFSDTVFVEGIVSDIVEASIKYSFKLYQNYPNPFNPETLITFYLPMTYGVQLKIFNSLGEIVKTLVNKEVFSGQHTVLFNGDDLPSGVYYYSLTVVSANGRQSHKLVSKMILLK